jgi:hypothetical protein
VPSLEPVVKRMSIRRSRKLRNMVPPRRREVAQLDDASARIVTTIIG